MDSHPSHQPLMVTFLEHLGREEALLREALANVTELHAAICRGDLAGGREICAHQPDHALALRHAAEAREAAATALAKELGLPCKGLTLAGLAAGLPPDQGAELLATRTRLTALASQLSTIQGRNANLLVHLRSFFRGVLSGVTAADAPIRYGPTGRQLEPTYTWSAIPARVKS